MLSVRRFRFRLQNLELAYQIFQFEAKENTRSESDDQPQAGPFQVILAPQLNWMQGVEGRFVVFIVISNEEEISVAGSRCASNLAEIGGQLGLLEPEGHDENHRK